MRAASLLLFAACSASVLAAPKRLTTLDQTMAALNSGHEVTLVLNYGKMTLEIDGKQEKAPEAIGGMKIMPWEYFAKGVIRNERAYLVTSETHMIAHSRYGYVDNYVRVRIFEDGAVEVTARYITLDKRETVMDETFRGRISNGRDKEGVSIFAR